MYVLKFGSEKIMKYVDIECPVCDEKFNDNDDIVVCPVCGTPHHRNCWKANGGCKNEEKHAEGFIWQTFAPETDDNDHSDSQGGKKRLRVCPRCGEKNAPFEPVCKHCGERLKANSQTIFDKLPLDGELPFDDFNGEMNRNNFSPYQNVYAADARTVFGDEAKIDDIPITEVAEYVQKDSTKYIGKFIENQEKKSKLSWNWSAGIFSVFWCFYRKMAGLGTALFAIFFSCYMISFVIPSYVYEAFRPEVYAAYESTLTQLAAEMSNVLASGAVTTEYYELFAEVLTSPIMITSYIMMIALVLLTSITFGFFANHLYKNKIVKDIHKIRQISGDSMTYHMCLQRRGGTSVLNIIIPAALYSIINMLLNYF